MQKCLHSCDERRTDRVASPTPQNRTQPTVNSEQRIDGHDVGQRVVLESEVGVVIVEAYDGDVLRVFRSGNRIKISDPVTLGGRLLSCVDSVEISEHGLAARSCQVGPP